jgi:transcriptional regulator with GAF, ATPase, and Fis domain
MPAPPITEKAMPSQDSHRDFEGMLGESRAMQEVFALIRRVAPTDGTVLVTGESGTGKEMVAQAIHRLSRRRDRPFLACDCTALAPTLLESELFGHVKGSFSGAIATKQGLFEVADQGTLFLDEVANLSLEIQGKLLRVLENRRVKKVGDTAEHEVDIRLVTATSQTLAELVKVGTFRADLYFRLNVVPVCLPPLRQRPEDIPILAAAFLEQFCGRTGSNPRTFSPEAVAAMASYPWPGNVRELRNIVQRVAILSEGDRIEFWHLPTEIAETPPLPAAGPLPQTWPEFKRLKRELEQAAVRDLERQFLVATLRRTGGNVSEAAKAIGLHRSNLHALLRKHGLSSDGLF